MFTLGDCLFRAAKLTKNVDPNKYGYRGVVLNLMYPYNFHCRLMNVVKMFWCRQYFINTYL